MPINVAIFEALNWGSAIVIFSFLAWQCFREKRLTPLMVMAIAVFSIFWQESPFDWATWCQFAPELPRIPPWGLLGMTSGGLPWIAPPGYVMYIATIVMIAVSIVQRMPERQEGDRVRNLLLVTFVVGFIWDVAFQQIGAWAGWWRYQRGFEGVTIFGGTRYTLSLPISYFMAITYTVAAYLAGRVDKDGYTPIEAWARRKVSSPAGATLLCVLITILAMQFTYLMMMMPNVIAKVHNLHSVAYTGELFDGMPPQPGPLPPDAATGWLGTLLVVGWLTAFLAGFIYLVMRFDPMAKRVPARGTLLAS